MQNMHVVGLSVQCKACHIDINGWFFSEGTMNNRSLYLSLVLRSYFKSSGVWSVPCCDLMRCSTRASSCSNVYALKDGTKASQWLVQNSSSSYKLVLKYCRVVAVSC